MTHSYQRTSADLHSIADESAPLFALKWSAAGTALALCLMMAGCDSFAPKETPRYNTVVGERRLPVMNAQMLSGQATSQAVPVPMVEQAPMPVPMVQSQPPEAPAPAPAPVQPAPEMMVQNNAPAPTPIMTPPQPQLQDPQNVSESPSMIDQLSGVFESNPKTEGMSYPSLPPTEQSAPTTQPIAPSIEAEMQALERDLLAAQQTQQTIAPAPQPAPAPTPDLTQQPLPETAFAPEAQALPWDGEDASGFAMQPIVPNVAPQPIPAAPMHTSPKLLPPPPPAPVYAPATQPYTPAPAPVAAPTAPTYEPVESLAPSYIPPSPQIYAAPQAAMPYGLTPPSGAGSYDEGFLPPSRYQGRRLHGQ